MNKEKLIEEMQNVIIENTAVYDSDVAQDVAETLIYAGYRKASEIFEEIESKKMFVRDRVGNMRVVVLFEDIAELKKKYSESEKDK